MKVRYVRYAASLMAVAAALALTLLVAFPRVAGDAGAPAALLGVTVAALFALSQTAGLSVGAADMALLFLFGAVNLGAGLALFTTGARLIPAVFTALLGTFEPIAAPIWVWLIHAEVPSTRTVVGGAVVCAALLVHIGLEFRRQARPRRPGVTGIPAPH